jgi:hypothetical protein
MWNVPNEKELNEIPRFYATENIKAADKIVHEHFFIAGTDMYIVEYDGDELFFGFTVLNGDTDNAEWGYISFTELKELRIGYLEVDRDLYWTKRPIKEINRIKEIAA